DGGAGAAGETEAKAEGAIETPAPKRRTTRAKAGTAAGAEATPGTVDGPSEASTAEPAAPKRRTTSRKAAPVAAAKVAEAPEPAAAAPKRRGASRKIAPARDAQSSPVEAAGGPDAGIPETASEAAAPKRRAAARKKAEPA